MITITRPPVRCSVPTVTLIASFFAAASAHAHHPMGGKPVTTALEGFLSGIAHPVIGMDHLAMIVAIGVLAAAVRPGFALAVVFVVAAMVGTGLHLLGMNLPGSEAWVSFSVVAVGLLIALHRTPDRRLVLGICALAGVLHGYAYGESIFGAETTPLTAYLVGFTVVQLIVAGTACLLAKKFAKKAGQPPLVLRPAGYVVAGFGLALLATEVATLTFPGS